MDKEEHLKTSVIVELSLARLGLVETGLEDKLTDVLLEEICIS